MNRPGLGWLESGNCILTMIMIAWRLGFLFSSQRHLQEALLGVIGFKMDCPF